MSMARAGTETVTPRAPRGTKPVAQAFLTALESIPVASRSAVAKAAQAMIRDELRNWRDKLKAVAAKEKLRQISVPKRAAKPATPKIVELVVKAPTKRRARKQDIAEAA